MRFRHLGNLFELVIDSHLAHLIIPSRGAEFSTVSEKVLGSLIETYQAGLVHLRVSSGVLSNARVLDTLKRKRECEWLFISALAAR